MATVLARLDHHAKARPDAAAYFRKTSGRWVATSWSTYRREIRQVGRALMALGLEPGETLGVLGFNRPEWSQSVLGCMSAGGAAAGIYTTNAAEQVRFILRDCKARVVVVENAMQLAKVTEVRAELPDLTHVVVMDWPSSEPADGSVEAGSVEVGSVEVGSVEAGSVEAGSAEAEAGAVLGWRDFLARGDEVFSAALDQRIQALTADQLATLIYTSGTTGEPKGVMLSHRNLIETVRIVAEPFSLGATDIGLSYLPLAHIAEQMMTIHTPVFTGSQIYYAESPEQVIDNLKEVRPTVLFGVPRVWERLYGGIQARLHQATGFKRSLADWAVETGRRAFLAEQEGKLGAVLAARRVVADRAVAGKVRQALGFDRLRVGVSGAAPIARENLEFFAALKIPIYEVYGLSETTGPLTWNVPGRTRLGTVGPPLPRVEIRLAADGEVQARGPNIFMGYLNKPEATAEVMEDDWFHTGDLGAIDDQGYLTITGRKKNLLITSGGKNIAPEGLETALKALDLVSEAVVLGEAQRFVAALLTLDDEAAARFISARDAPRETVGDQTDGAALAADPRILEELQRGVDSVNGRFSRVESIRQFRVLPRQLSMDEGELTPTLKVKRAGVLGNWAELIDEIYGD